MNFDIEKRLSPGLAVVSTDGIRALWHKCRLNKNRTCGATKQLLKAGEQHYRPITNGSYRYVRLSTEFVENS